MLPGESGHLLVKNQRGSNTVSLVGRNAHSNAGAADQQAKIASLVRDILGHRVSIIRVIRRIGRKGAKIMNIDSLRLQVNPQRFFEQEPGMIGAEGHDELAVRPPNGGRSL